jgi:hypothetical protein
MNATRIPGFTAEASLYRGRARYYGGPKLELGRGEKGIIHPALPMRTFCVPSGETGYTMCCWVWDGGHYCWWKNTIPFQVDAAQLGPRE